MKMEVEASLVIEELKALLSDANYKLALAGARIIQQQREIEGILKAMTEKKNDNASRNLRSVDGAGRNPDEQLPPVRTEGS